MKLFKVLSALVVTAVLALAVSGCATTATHDGSGGHIDDMVITTNDK